MRTVIILSTVFFLNFTAFTQIDSLTCFTPSQIKTFLRTKVELNNCTEQLNIVLSDLSESKQLSDKLEIDNTTLKVKVKRNRRIAIGGGVVSILAIGVVILK